MYIYIYIFIYHYIYSVYYTIGKKLSYFLRKCDLFRESYLLRKLVFSLEKRMCSKIVNYLLHKNKISFENNILTKKVNCMFRKYDCFIRKYFLPTKLFVCFKYPENVSSM